MQSEIDRDQKDSLADLINWMIGAMVRELGLAIKDSILSGGKIFIARRERTRIIRCSSNRGQAQKI